MGIFHLLGSAAKHKISNISQAIKARDRLDTDLPLGLKFGGAVDIPELAVLATKQAFRIPEGSDLNARFIDTLALQVTIPRGYKTIVGWSKTQWYQGLWIYRFYFSDDAGFLEVTTQTDAKTPIEGGVKFWSLVDELFPSDDWDSWLPSSDKDDAEEGWWIGNLAFPLPDLEIDEEGNWVAWSYHRLWSPNQERCVNPEMLEEIVHLHPVQESLTSKISHECMLYGRFPPVHLIKNYQADDSTPMEYLLLTATTDLDGKGIEIWAGIDVYPDDLDII